MTKRLTRRLTQILPLEDAASSQYGRRVCSLMNPYEAKRLVSLPAIVLSLVAAVASSRPSASAETYVLPSSAFRAGANGAEFHSDVRVLNLGPSPATVTVSFYDQVSGQTVTAAPFDVGGRNQASFDNILSSLFGRTLAQGVYGPIRFASTRPLVISSSVNNVNACGNKAVSGQWLPGIDVGQAMRAGVIAQLAVSSNSAAGYRTNIVFMNPGPQMATVTASIRRGGGGLISSGTIGPLGTNGFSQVALDGSTFPGVAVTTDTNLWLEFTSDQPVLGFASVINNASGDPFAIMATPDPGTRDAQEITVTLPGGVPLTLVRIPAGTFQMGSPVVEQNHWSNETLHHVMLTSDYYIGKYEVTQGQWRAVMGYTPNTSPGCGDSCPVQQVSWNDVAGPSGFIDKLNEYLGTTKLRLPTEAEWERAARGGTQTRFSFGDALDSDDVCEASAAASPYVWWCHNAKDTMHPVGSKAPNPYGLYDMHGNLWEWVNDWYGAHLGTSPQTDATGPCSATIRFPG